MLDEGLSRTSSLLRCIHFESVNSKSTIKEMQLAIQVKVDVFLQKGYTPGKWLNYIFVEFVNHTCHLKYL